MPRSGTLIGSLKSLFKTSRNGSQKQGASMTSNTPHGALATASGDGSPSLSDILECRDPPPLSSPKADGELPSSSVVSAKGLSRKLLLRNKNNSFSPSRSAVSISEAAVCHILSDPCAEGNNQAALNGRSDCGAPVAKPVGLRIPAQTSHLLRGDSPPLFSSDSTPQDTCDNSRRCMSLDIPAAPLTSPAAFGKQRQLLHVVLSSKDPSLHSQSRDMQHSSSLLSSSDMLKPESPAPPQTSPPPPAGDAAPNTTLLALCPGTPAAMRRRQWCVEDYEVSRRIYKGAYSTVYKAICRHSGLPVALKVYLLSKVPKNVVHMIVREIKIHVGVVHKHVVMLYAAFQDEKRLVLVQEYAGRGDLYGIYRSLNRRMSEAQLVLLVLAPFMEAMSYLHARGICHRDIKPENILFTTDWRLLIADFGVSIDLNQECAVTRAGTLEYMAPEVERCPLKMLPEENKENDGLSYTTAVDIWATGVLAYELMVGFPPFVGDRMAVAVGGAEVRGNVCKALSFPIGTSPNARDFIGRALSEAPEERPTAMQLNRHPWLDTQRMMRD